MLLIPYVNYKDWEYLQHKLDFPTHITVDEAIHLLVLRIKDEPTRILPNKNN